MAALQLVRDAAEQCDAGMALALQQAVMPRLATLLAHPEPVLQSGALRAAASLLGASLGAGPAPMAVDGPAAAGNGAPEAGGAAAQPLLAALKGVLDVGGAQEFPAELEDSALDAGWWPLRAGYTRLRDTPLPEQSLHLMGGPWRVTAPWPRCLVGHPMPTEGPVFHSPHPYRPPMRELHLPTSGAS